MFKQSHRNICLIGLMLVASGLLAQATETLYIPKTIPYGKEVIVREAVRDECQLEEKLAHFINSYAGRAYANIVREKPKSGKYHVLDAEITDVLGLGGGAWSGNKTVTIKGALKDQNGKVIATFAARRYSTGGAFAGFKGTCSILGRCTKAIGKDVGSWLADPKDKAALGDF